MEVELKTILQMAAGMFLAGLALMGFYFMVLGSVDAAIERKMEMTLQRSALPERSVAPIPHYPASAAGGML